MQVRSWHSHRNSIAASLAEAVGRRERCFGPTVQGLLAAARFQGAVIDRRVTGAFEQAQDCVLEAEVSRFWRMSSCLRNDWGRSCIFLRYCLQSCIRGV